MKLAFPVATALIITGTLTSRGVSDEAGFVECATESGRNRLQDSYSLGLLGKGAFDELFQVAEESKEANWDGYGAEPVSAEAYLSAFRFLEALPLGIPAPTIGAEPDGDITLEWYHSSRRLLSVSISPDCELNYAALLPGPRKARGTEQFVGAIPTRILSLIEDVVSSEVTALNPVA